MMELDDNQVEKAARRLAEAISQLVLEEDREAADDRAVQKECRRYLLHDLNSFLEELGVHPALAMRAGNLE